MLNSVAHSTRLTYDRGWAQWVVFASLMGVFPTLSNLPTGWSIANSPFSFQISFAMAFCAYFFHECKLCPNTICTYLAGVAFHLDIRNVSAAFLTCPAMLRTRTGLKVMFEKSQPQKRRTTPFSLEMILFFLRSGNMADLNFNGYVVTLFIAFCNLLRCSEYCPDKNNDHFMRSQDVCFTTQDGRQVPSHAVSGLRWESVTGVSFVVRSSKTDNEKVGYKMYCEKRKVLSPYCLCKICFDWAKRANSKPFDPFLSASTAQGRRVWTVNPQKLSAIMKNVGRHFNFAETANFSTHSLRYGGASALAAAGLNQYVIQLMGRWKSMAFLQYIQLASSSWQLAYNAVMDPSLMTVNDIKLLR